MFLIPPRILFELFDLEVELNNFLLGKKIECAVILHCVKLFKSLDSLLDGLEVCHHTAEPSCVYIVSVCSAVLLP